jgi:hypothetical protein
MDLIVFGSSAHQQSLYRTVSWQKVATINQDSELPLSQDEKTCWSPNGRWVTVSYDHQVSLYGVEPLANPSGGVTFTNSGPTEAQHSWHSQHKVIALSWAHVGRLHPTAWKASEDELEDEISWRYVKILIFLFS